MKTLCVLLFAAFLAIAVAEDSQVSAPPVVETQPAATVAPRVTTRVTKSTKAYKRAKEACVKTSDGKLKGKKLTECIVNYQKEAK